MTPDRLPKLLKLHEADPADAEICYMIALEHGKADRIDEALHWLDETIRREPKMHYAYFQQGKLLGAAGRTSDARAALQRGVERATADGNYKAVGEINDLLASLEE